MCLTTASGREPHSIRVSTAVTSVTSRASPERSKKDALNRPKASDSRAVGGSTLRAAATAINSPSTLRPTSPVALNDANGGAGSS
jgi:hypothetical protein